MSTVKPLCIIMARGGSKRVPRKNVRIFCGKPMIAWPIQTAINSELFSSVIISTDDAEIATVAQEYGAKIPFMRPEAVADDFSTTADVLRHALHTLQRKGNALPPLCCCLYGTSSMLTTHLLQHGYNILQKRGVECVYAVTEYPHPIERALTLDKDYTLRYKDDKFATTRTQDLTPAYYDIGLFYWFSVQAFLQHGSVGFSPLRKSAVVVPRFAATDIDTTEDWAFAEKLMQIQWENS